MVKVRGTRIELGEVERAALSGRGVREACAAAVPDERLGHRILLAVTPSGVAPGDVLNACRRRLPPAAVPEMVVTVRALPRTDRGKVDRQAVVRLVQWVRRGSSDARANGY
jgi:acyl-CoA synthetase (AMP-forming)/AMP-acid ligase II